MKQNDELFFVHKNKIIGKGLFQYYNKRVFGPLVRLSKTDQELGYKINNGKKYEIEITFINIRLSSTKAEYIYVKGQCSIRQIIKPEFKRQIVSVATATCSTPSPRTNITGNKRTRGC
jgi:hypothetical protein